MKIIMNKSVFLTGITTLALILSVNAQAKIYKWKDANGRTHYSAQPPAQKNQKIKAKNIEDEIRSNAGKYRPPAQKDSAKSADGENKDGEEKAELSGPNKQLVKYCDSQRNNLEQLKKNFRNVWIDVKGNKTTLNQEQRREKVTYLESKIKEDCADVTQTKKT